ISQRFQAAHQRSAMESSPLIEADKRILKIISVIKGAPGIGRLNESHQSHPGGGQLLRDVRARNCRSWSFVRTNSETTAPTSAIAISDCVSHTLPWVARKLSAESPVATATPHSKSS